MKMTWTKCGTIGLAVWFIGGYVVPWLDRYQKETTALHGGTPAIRVATLRSGVEVEDLIEALHDEDTDVRMVAAQQLRAAERQLREGNLAGRALIGPQAASQRFALSIRRIWPTWAPRGSSEESIAEEPMPCSPTVPFAS